MVEGEDRGSSGEDVWPGHHACIEQVLIREHVDRERRGIEYGGYAIGKRGEETGICEAKLAAAHIGQVQVNVSEAGQHVFAGDVARGSSVWNGHSATRTNGRDAIVDNH